MHFLELQRKKYINKVKFSNPGMLRGCLHIRGKIYQGNLVHSYVYQGFERRKI